MADFYKVVNISIAYSVHQYGGAIISKDFPDQ
jgi:hypothetical protein